MPEFVEPRPLVLPELEPLFELLLSPELLLVVPEVLLLECFAETTATETPVAPTPRTAVAIAAAEARRNQRGPVGWDSSVLTMPQASAGALQPHSKRSSSHRQVLLKGL
ncbi:hypothetical protein [Kribbella sp.]|uniref:hypothetical protein n=1 Tax=Kribbella sp. TaxID=1871183 RepID=UPI002D4D1F7E|nr:hypothetical protein [Kribbella sp.]HZX06548.1 hypothetical protein [Kribbella sp.]